MGEVCDFALPLRASMSVKQIEKVIRRDSLAMREALDRELN